MWDREKVSRVPMVYRDILKLLENWLLQPASHSAFKVTRVPFGMLLAEMGRLCEGDLLEMLEILKGRGFIDSRREEDGMGSCWLTAAGFDLTCFICEMEKSHYVPPLPSFEE